VLARDRVLEVPGPLGALLPGGALQRGTVATVGGDRGAGVTTVTLGLAAAATAAGEWAAAVDLPGTLGGLAAREAGVELSRFAVVRDVPGDRWAAVVAALLDGVSLVVADVPRGLRAADARRLVARARERSTVLVMVESLARAWPADAALRLRAEGGAWPGLGPGQGVLAPRPVRLRVEGRGTRSGVRTTGRALALTG
jgi:RecA/RadA recombinase